MSDASIIKEFLVALGVKVDDPGIKKFQEGIAGVTKVAIQFASVIEDMAIAAEAAVAKVSSKFEDLYYASQRIYDTVENIRGYAFAISQVGGSAQGAMAALENMGEFFRSNPGGERFVQGLGVATRQTNGDLRNMTDIMSDLAAKFRQMPYYVAKVRAEQLGIDPRTLQAMLRGTDEAQARFKALADSMGVDQQAAAKASHDFMNDLRDLLAMITLSVDKVVLIIQPMARQVVDWLERLHKATDGWSTALMALVAVLGPLLLFVDPLVIGIAALAAIVVAIIGHFSDWREGLTEVGGGLADILDALQPLIQAIIGLGTLIAKVFGPAIRPLLNATFTLIADGLHMVADVIRLVIDLLTLNWAKAWADNRRLGLDMVKALSDAFMGLWNIIKGVGAGIKDAWNWLNGRTSGAAQAPATSAWEGSRSPVAANQNTPVGTVEQATRGVAGQIADFFQKNGFSSQAAAGITAGAYAESKLNPNAVNPTSGAYGIGQWLGPRKDELFRRYGPNPSLAQQLQFMLSEMTGGGQNGAAGANIRGQASAFDAMQTYITQFMRPGNGTLGDLRRGSAYLNTPLGQQMAAGGSTVTMSQKTDITVVGANDPAATARHVAEQQALVNNGMVRQLRSAAS